LVVDAFGPLNVHGKGGGGRGDGSDVFVGVIIGERGSVSVLRNSRKIGPKKLGGVRSNSRPCLEKQAKRHVV